MTNVTTAAMGKRLEFDTCEAVLAPLREQGRRVVLCHGVFDLLHPGHIAHLQEARELGDLLVVSITSSPNVNKGPGRPIFNDEQRLFSLASLGCVDHVMVAPGPTALEVIDAVKPAFYAKGHEYARAEDDVTQNIDREAERVRAHGGEIAYAGKVVFSSTKLINNFLDGHPPHVRSYATALRERVSFDGVRRCVDEMRKLKVLVLGDVIIDEFIHCKVQGLTAKGRVISARFQKKEQHLGGSLAIAAHVADFAGQVTVAGVVGKEPEIHSLILNKMTAPVRLDLQYEDNYPTVVKRRYIERMGKREDYNKLFAINFLEEEGLDVVPSQRERILERIERTIGDYDLVILADFGHGLVDPALMDLLQDKAAFLSVNCQTNSANHGFNLFTKYRRADAFALDEQEIRLAFAEKRAEPEHLLRTLHRQLGASQGWLTLGSAGSLGLDRVGNLDSAPALTLHVTDTTGAGDAFFALASLAARLEAPLEMGSVLGNLAGAICANVLGNAEPVQKGRLLKFASTLLNY